MTPPVTRINLQQKRIVLTTMIGCNKDKGTCAYLQNAAMS